MPKVNPFILTELRNKKKWSREQLAEKAKVNPKTISRIEHGRQRDTRPLTVRSLAGALDVEEARLTLEVTVQNARDQYDVTLSRMEIEISTLARNALYLVARKYNVVQSSVVELAPFLFCWAAEASLRQRRNHLEQAERALEKMQKFEWEMPHVSVPDSGPTKEMLAAESDSINSQDIWGQSLYEAGFQDATFNDGTDNPFAKFLGDLAEGIGGDATLDTFSYFDYPEYRICSEDATLIAGGDYELAEEILSGHVALHEMPKELQGIGKWKEKADWARAKATEYREGMRAEAKRYHEDRLHSVGQGDQNESSGR